MKASLTIENVGGIKGKRSFELDRGHVNLLSSANSGGKSSIMRGILAALAFSPEEAIDSAYLSETMALGIKTDPNYPTEGFVNIHSDVAKTTLDFDGETKSVTLGRDGKVIDRVGKVEPKFIYAGILSNNSRILRQLRGSGNLEPDDFEWAVTEMSLAKNYEIISGRARTLKEDLENKLKIYKNSVNKFTELNNKVASLQKKKDAVEEKRKLHGFVENTGKYGEKNERLNKTIDGLKTDIVRLKREVDSAQNEIEKIVSEKKKLQAELEELKSRKIEWDSSDEDARVEKEKEAIRQKIDKLKEEKSTVDGLLNLLVVADSSIKGADHDAACPLCEMGKLSKSSLLKRLTGLRDEREQLSKKMMELAEQGRNIEGDSARRRKENDELRRKIGALEFRIKQECDNKTLTLQNKYEQANQKLSDQDDRLKQNLQELNKLRELFSKEDKEKYQEYLQLEGEREQIRDMLIIAEDELEKCKVTSHGNKTILPDEAMKITNGQIDIVNKIIIEMDKKAEDQKEEARKKFHSTIKDLLDELGFNEFKNVALNKDYRLYVERFDETRKDYVKQNASTLSTSEKLAIALILQMALKETYFSEVPFLLMDDVLEDFDIERQKVILSYLSRKAKDSNLFIMVTKLVEGLEAPQVEIV